MTDETIRQDEADALARAEQALAEAVDKMDRRKYIEALREIAVLKFDLEILIDMKEGRR